MTASAIPRFSLIRAPNECLAEPNERSLDFERIRCPVKPGHARGRRIYPLDVVIPCNPAPDVIFTWMSECLIQASVRDIFKSEGLTGFSTLPASATIRKTGASVPVSDLSIVGWGGMAPASSDIREIERCLACGHLHYSGVLNPERLISLENWDGSDFFMVWPLPRFRFVTERVVEVCRRHRVTGLEFSTNWPDKHLGGSGFSPGRLSYYMPAERAQILGSALGID